MDWLFHLIGGRFEIHGGGIRGPAKSLREVHRLGDRKRGLWQYVQTGDRSFGCLSHGASMGASQLDLLIDYWAQRYWRTQESRVRGCEFTRIKDFLLLPTSRTKTAKLRYGERYSESDSVRISRVAKKARGTCNQSTKNAANISRRVKRCRTLLHEEGAIENLIIASLQLNTSFTLVC